MDDFEHGTAGGGSPQQRSEVIDTAGLLTKMDLTQVLKEIKDKGLKMVRFEFTDYNGIMRCKVIPARHFEEKAKDGIGILKMYLSLDPLGEIPEEELKREQVNGYCDAICFPALETFRILPWLKDTAGVLTYTVYQNQPVKACPRNIAKRQLDELASLGYSLLSAHEYEFTVIDRKTQQPIMEDSSYSSCQRLLEAGELLEELGNVLPQVGVDVESIYGEHGQGQIEITYKPAFGIEAADKAIIYRNAVKEVSWKHDLLASFMSRPHRKWATCSAHFNHSLFDLSKSKPVLFDANNTHGLSKVAQHWIAGLITHCRAIVLLMAPTLNCIQRFHSNPVVPSVVNWGIDNRTTALRVKVNGDHGTYFENRLGAAGGNPYLSLTATVAAGIDGIRKQLPLPDSLNSSPDKSTGEKLPDSLDEAVDCFLKDDVICKAFGEDFIKSFISVKNHEKKLRDSALGKGQDEFEWARDFYFKYL